MSEQFIFGNAPRAHFLIKSMIHLYMAGSKHSLEFKPASVECA